MYKTWSKLAIKYRIYPFYLIDKRVKNRHINPIFLVRQFIPLDLLPQLSRIAS